MAPLSRAVALALCLSSACLASEQRAVANPIRKVVTLLQNMQAKVTAEGEKEDDLYKKFMCYCKTGVGELEARIEAAGTKGPQLEADIKESEAKLVQTKQALADAQKERTEAKAAIASAEAIREKAAKAFAATKAELEGYISQISSAVAALEKGMAGSFLQARSASAALLRVVEKAESVSDDDKEVLTSFLSGKATYAPKSGEITGILKQMGDEFAKSLKDEEDAEATAIEEHEALVGAKKKEIDTLTASIEQKLASVGELGMSIVQMKADYESIAGDLLEDKKLLADLKEGCGTKDAEDAELELGSRSAVGTPGLGAKDTPQLPLLESRMSRLLGTPSTTAGDRDTLGSTRGTDEGATPAAWSCSTSASDEATPRTAPHAVAISMCATSGVGSHTLFMLRRKNSCQMA